jgi:hypothetical protein
VTAGLMNWNTLKSWGLLGGVLVSLAAARAAAIETLPTRLKSLVSDHCVHCHGADTKQARLRLDTLATDLNDPAVARRWEKVFDKLAAGEMPPKSESQPPQEMLTAVKKQLREELHQASLRRQRDEGRVVVRRLNGTEYENTLHDLLRITVPLRELLPEDSSAAGFDNVSTGLDLSATHFLRYQEAAARAVTAVVPVHPPIPYSDTRTGLDMTKKGPNFNEGLGRNSKLSGDSLVIYSKLPRYGLCATAAVPSAGRYRVTLKAGAVGAEEKPIPVGLMDVMQSGREGPVLREVVDIPHGEPRELVFECDLVSRQQFVVNLLTVWDIRRFRKPLDEYTGPGLRVDWMKIEGPLDSFPPPRYATLFDGVPLKARSVVKAEATGGRVPTINVTRTAQQWEADPLVPASDKPQEDAERLIRSFLSRAFRRPATEAEQQHFAKATLRKLEQGHTFYDAMQYGYQLILSSPSFLFLLESSDPKLNDFALAARLSYFLWSTGPDAELLDLAKRGELHQPTVLHAQVDRMLNSPLAQRFTKNFTGQWLDLRKIDFTIPDPVLYSDFDPLLLWSMPRETELFFDEVVRRDLSLLNFVDSDWSMLNERLATLYGIPGVQGSELKRTLLPAEARRGGVMTQASVLKVTADGTRTSPVLRGTWVLDRIVGKPPAPPPPDVPAIEPDIRGATTIRQQLDKHRNVAACATCHNHIDPPGFALETFDPIGNWRDFYRVTSRTSAGLVNLPYGSGRPIYRGPDVELGGQTPEGKAFKDITDYKRLLLEDKDQLVRNLVRKMIVFSTGADIQFADREVVDEIVAKLRTKNYGFRTLIHEVVQSRVFTNK